MNNRILYLLLTVLLTGSIISASAQDKQKAGSSARPAFDVGDNTLGFSFGLGSTASYYGKGTNLPAFSFNFDHGIIGHVGPGTIGIGGVIGWQSTYYNYPNYEARWTSVIIGARGTYHLTILKDKNNHFDPYGGVTIGYRSVTYSNDDHNYVPGDYRSAPYFGIFVGAKYNFSPRFGAFSELGYDISFFRIGVHVNF